MALRLSSVAASWSNLGPMMRLDLTQPYFEDTLPEIPNPEIEQVEEEFKVLWQELSKQYVTPSLSVLALFF